MLPIAFLICVCASAAVYRMRNCAIALPCHSKTFLLFIIEMSLFCGRALMLSQMHGPTSLFKLQIIPPGECRTLPVQHTCERNRPSKSPDEVNN